MNTNKQSIRISSSSRDFLNNDNFQRIVKNVTFLQLRNYSFLYNNEDFVYLDSNHP
jgi:hypothetical protein